MTKTLIQAGSDLAEILARENSLLEDLDYPGAAALGLEKEHAITAFTQLRSVQDLDATPLILGLRLKELIAENKRLLEQAMYVQGRVIACIARAAPRHNENARAYGATGAWACDGRAVPIALTARV